MAGFVQTAVVARSLSTTKLVEDMEPECCVIHCDQTEFGRMIQKKFEMDILSDLNAYLLVMHNAYLLAMPKQTRGVLKFSIRGTIK